MAEPLNWDEFRIVRAIAEAQSLSGAAELLGLNHSTLFRRLAAMEARLGLRLFDRERTGYRPTAAGEDMVALATLMGDTIAEFERRVSRNDVKLSGRVRVTALTSLGALVLPPICAALAAAHPGLHVEVILTDSSPDLERGEADIALRCLKEPPPESLTGRRVAPLPWAIYAVPALTTADGEPGAERAVGRPFREFRSAAGAALVRPPYRDLAARGDRQQRHADGGTGRPRARRHAAALLSWRGEAGAATGGQGRSRA